MFSSPNPQLRLQFVREAMKQAPNCKHGLKLDFCAICQGEARPYKTPYKRSAPQRSVVSVHQQWTIPTLMGNLVICGVCSGPAKNDDSHLDEVTVKLTAFQKLNICRYCEGKYHYGVECSASPTGFHKRKYNVRSIKVPACPGCSTKPEYEIEWDRLQMLPGLIINEWRLRLAHKNLLRRD